MTHWALNRHLGLLKRVSAFTPADGLLSSLRRHPRASCLVVTLLPTECSLPLPTTQRVRNQRWRRERSPGDQTSTKRCTVWTGPGT
jgi:hypothetical protein